MVAVRVVVIFTPGCSSPSHNPKPDTLEPMLPQNAQNG